MRETKFFAQLRKAGRDSASGVKPRVDLVSCLLCRVRPLAVLFAVVAVVVNAVNACPFRALTHIGFEVCELHPSFANGYTSPSVAGVFWQTRVCASANHSQPNAICLRELSSPGLAVGNPVLAPCGAAWRSAGCRLAVPERVDGYIAFLSAVTPAPDEPASFASRTFQFDQKRDDNQLSKSGSNGYIEGRHSDYGTITVFSSGHSASTDGRCVFSTPSTRSPQGLS